jgi:hypothetical protein
MMSNLAVTGDWHSFSISFDDEVGACQRLAMPVRRLLDRFHFNWGSILESRFRQHGSGYGFKRRYVERGTTPEQLEKQVPVGRRRFENSRENKLAWSQLVASVN